MPNKLIIPFFKQRHNSSVINDLYTMPVMLRHYGESDLIHLDAPNTAPTNRSGNIFPFISLFLSTQHQKDCKGFCGPYSCSLAHNNVW
jgi:hypothetical protein